MKILLIDNFDSFTYNLSHYLDGLGAEVHVVRENEYSSKLLKTVDKVILSPGPGLPKDSKGLQACLKDAMNNLPILGVCLGMQAIVESNGGKLYNQKIVKHGVEEVINRVGESILLNNVSNPFQVGLYHSWAVDIKNTSVLKVTARSKSGVIMAIESENAMLFGVQFHPESVMTPEGKSILRNFLEC